MIASARAHMLALRKRPGVLLIAAILAFLVGAFGYALLYLFFGVLGEELDPGMAPTGIIDALLPDNAPAMAVSMAGSYGGPAAVVLGALAVGSEYGWRVHRLTMIQGPARTPLHAGKLLAIVGLALALALLVVAVTGVASVGVGAAEGALAGRAPSAASVLAATAAGWLVLAVWALIGALLATLFRGTGVAIGVGLVYSFLIEGLLAGLPLDLRALDVTRRVLITANADALASAFGQTTAGVMAVPGVETSPAWAAVVLLCYGLAAAALSCLVFARRDVA